MVARLFRAVAEMDLKVTHNKKNLAAKISALQAKVDGSSNPRRSVQSGQDSEFSGLKSLRRKAQIESSELMVLNETFMKALRHINNGLASVRKRVELDHDSLSNDVNLERKQLFLEMDSNVSGFAKKINSDNSLLTAREKMERKNIAGIQLAVANLQTLTSSMHSRIATTDKDNIRKESRYQDQFRRLQQKVSADSAMIESINRHEKSARSSETDSNRIQYGMLRKLSKELAKVRLKEKSDAEKAAALKKGLGAVEDDLNLLHNKETSLRSKVTSEERTQRSTSRKISSMKRHMTHLTMVRM